MGSFTLLLTSGLACAAPTPECTITSTAISFGNYDPLSSTSLTGTGTLGFSCTKASLTGVDKTVTFVIALSTGSGSYGTRIMNNGAYSLDYNLYTDTTYTSVWGDGTAGTAEYSSTYAKTQAPAVVTVYVYGLIPAQQNAVPGSYTDSITATVTF
ncbi:MAG: spore coat U domain-containing protein [Gammaproteobacteria bacterium]